MAYSLIQDNKLISKLVIFSLTFLFNITLTHCTLTKRTSMPTAILVWAASWLCLAIGYIILYRHGIRNTFTYYALNIVSFGACCYLFRENLAQKVFLFFAVWGISTFVSALCNWATFLLPFGGWDSAIKALAYVSIYSAIIPLFRRYWASSVKEVLALFSKGTPVYAAFPFIAFVLFAALFGPMTKTSDLRWFGLMLLFESLIIFMYYLLFSHFHLIFNRLRAEDRLDKAEEHRALQKRYYEEVDKGVQAQSKLLHDMRHHLLAVAALARTEDAAAVSTYIGQLLDNLGVSRMVRHCEHDVANAVISSYVDIAKGKGIKVMEEIDLPQDIGIDGYDLCTLFGNTIENAIEACERMPPASTGHAERFIDIRCSSKDGRLVVRIENSCGNAPVMENCRVKSSKGPMGGLGLESVRMIVDSYSGSMNFDCANSSFVLSAILYQRA